MATLLRTTAIWTGFPGAPGYTNHYWYAPGGADTAAATNAVTRMRDLFNSMTLCFPSPVNIAVQGTVATIESETGAQVGELLAPTPANLVGAGPANYAGPAGACITWRTTGFIGGRRLRGRTFLVPLTTSAYEGDGTILASRLAEMRTGATAHTVAGANLAQFVVWKRPTAGGANGGYSTASAATVNDRVAILKSRR